MKKFGISENQLIAITIDSGANVTRAVDDLIEDLEDSDETVGDPTSSDFNEPLEDDNLDGDHLDDSESEMEDLENQSEDDELEIIAHGAGAATVRVHCAAHKLQLGVNWFLFRDKRNAALIVLASKLAARL